MQRARLLFLAKFLGLLIASYLFVAWQPVNDRVILPFTQWIATTSGFLLNVLGQEVTASGTLIRSAQFAVQINNGCNGVEAMLILLAAVVAFPATPRAKLTGLFLGVIIVQLLNFVRVVTLYLLGAHQPRLFEIFHTAVWQTVVILTAIGFFLVWSARVGPPRVASRA